MKPPICYYGGKTRLALRIAALLPPHGHYVEPYAGSLAVLLAKTPSRMETANDLNRSVMAWWRVLRDRPGDLARVCALTPHSRAEAEEAHQPAPPDHPDLELETARRTWVRLTQARATGLGRATGWRHYVAPHSATSMPGYLSGYLSRVAPVAERLHRVSLECAPALDVIERYGADPDVLIYADPPYVPSTRASRHYGHELDESAHRELAAALRACRATVVLSGYASGLYEDLFDDWHRTELDASTTQGTGEAGRTEVLWSNRGLAATQGALFEGEVA